MPSRTRPATLSSYRDWVSAETNISVGSGYERYYDAAAEELLRQWEASPRWIALLDALPNWEAEYRLANGDFGLFMTQTPVLVVKPFASFLEKTWRHNVLDNRRWPNPPEKGWLLPDGWFEKVNDVLRARLTVKYLDGVLALVDRIPRLAESSGGKCRTWLEARPEGYYGAHLYFSERLRLPDRTVGEPREIGLVIELQLTTQVKEVIGDLTHRYYRERRTRGPSGEKWQWNFRSDEFVPNYLGHLLHYVEGMIMEVRARPPINPPQDLTEERDVG